MLLLLLLLLSVHNKAVIKKKRKMNFKLEIPRRICIRGNRKTETEKKTSPLRPNGVAGDEIKK